MKLTGDQFTPDTPRPLANCGATIAPGQDARWRGVKPLTKKQATKNKTQVINRLDVLDAQLRAR